MRQDVTDYVKGCAECQRNKVNNQAQRAPLSPIFARPEVLPFEMVAMDFIVKLPLSNGFDSILTLTDHDCTKAVILIPCNESITGEGVAKLYLDHAFKRVGLAQKFIHDRDSKFMGNFYTWICKSLGIERNTSTAYHPITDGQTEWINQEIEQYLRIFINERQNDWADWLSMAQFAYNDKVHSSTGYSPFFLNYGRHPYKGTEPRRKVTNKSAVDFKAELEEAGREATSALKKAAEDMKRYCYHQSFSFNPFPFRLGPHTPFHHLDSDSDGIPCSS